MAESAAKSTFDKLRVASLYCPFCRQARPVRLKLLLCLPQGDKYAYYCQECGAELAAKMEKGES